MKHRIKNQDIILFAEMLRDRERSEITIRKYTRDIRTFQKWLGEEDSFDKVRIIQYKEDLQKQFRTSSTNSMLSALNSFLVYKGWRECRVSTLKVQRQSFRSAQRNLSKEEYFRLLRAAKASGRDKLVLMMETIASTGIRIGELPFITVEALKAGRAVVTLKRKTREVILPYPLRKKLTGWCSRSGITEGPVFITRNGTPIDRSSVLRMMKSLSEAANVPVSKIFPHNLRHLFAVNYYEQEKDIVRLADLLGHSNINTTRIYTMTTCERELTALNRVAEEFIL